MVRIIEVPPSTNHDLPQQVEQRKAVIHKISIRSNLQNPIKRWNLVANDDFQNDLSRYFGEKTVLRKTPVRVEIQKTGACKSWHVSWPSTFHGLPNSLHHTTMTARNSDQLWHKGNSMNCSKKIPMPLSGLHPHGSFTNYTYWQRFPGVSCED